MLIVFAFFKKTSTKIASTSVDYYAVTHYRWFQGDLAVCYCFLTLQEHDLNSPVVVLNTIGAEVDFFSAQRSFLAIFSPTNDTSTTPTMAGSLQIAAPTTPNPTNNLANALLPAAMSVSSIQLPQRSQ